MGHLIRLIMYSFLVKLIQIWGDPRILAAFRICFKGSEAIDIQSRRPGVTVSRGARVKRSEICVSKSGNCLLSWISIINSVWSYLNCKYNVYTLSFKGSFYFIMLIGLHVYYLLLGWSFKFSLQNQWRENKTLEMMTIHPVFLPLLVLLLQSFECFQAGECPVIGVLHFFLQMGPRKRR